MSKPKRISVFLLLALATFGCESKAQHHGGHEEHGEPEHEPQTVRLSKEAIERSQSRVAKIDEEQNYLHARLELGARAGWPATHLPEPAGTLDRPHDPPTREALAVAARRHQPRVRTLHALGSEARARAPWIGRIRRNPSQVAP